MDTISSAPVTSRLNSIDFARGLVIVIMALDHARDLLHITSLTQDPVDLATTTPQLFLTRWITHFCAPVFVFLAGTSVFLMRKKQAVPVLRRFLLTRGLWLILLELTIINFGFWSDIYFRTILLQVIFAIGSSFVILSMLIGLPSRWLGLAGLAIIVLHNLLPQQPFKEGAPGLLWGLFLEGGFFKMGAERALVIGYPVLPWLGIMLLGFWFGKAFELEAQKRRRLFVVCGSVALLLFAALRGVNLYGDPKPWVSSETGIFKLLSFVNVTKYPPSLLYASMTLSVLFFVLAAAEGSSNALVRFFTTYGRVPMFFYLIHWYIIHASMYVMVFLQGATAEQMKFGILQFGRPETGVGLGLPGLYLYWLCLIAATYPLCRWYGKYKAAHRENKWLAYL